LVLFFKKELLPFLVVLWASPVVAQSVQVTGMVAHSGAVALAGLKPVTVAGSFQTMGGTQAHHWSGPLLLDVLDVAGIADAPGKKTHFRHVIMASGADGYAVAVALGEIDPIGEGKQVIVALTQDGKALDKPRLVVPGDSHAARGVHDLVGLEVR
jgi:hypothetical protein